MSRATVRIGGSRWYDLGSDVSWECHGGMWGRPSAPGDPLWYVIRFDQASDDDEEIAEYHRRDRYPCAAACFEIDTSAEHSASLRSCGILNLDDPWETGERPTPWQRATIIAEAAARCGEGRVNTVEATKMGDGPARRVRAAAARVLHGSFLHEGPYRVR